MKGPTWLKLFAVVLLLVGMWWGLQAAGVDLGAVNPERVQSIILSFGIWAPVVYLLAYAQPVVPLPASIMTIAGGLAFGPMWGWLAALTGATMRACSQFLVARLLGRRTVDKLLKGPVARLDQRIGEHGFQTVLLLRLIPSLPFDVLNYAIGFSKVRFGPYVLGSVLGMIPGTFAYVYLGYSLTDPEHIWKLVVAMLIVVGLIVAQQLYTRRKRRPA